MDRRGRHHRQLSNDSTIKDQLPDWRPDGKLIASHGADDIWLIKPDSTSQRNITINTSVRDRNRTVPRPRPYVRPHGA
jgi:Tol biopolymer transport system component